MNILDSKEHNRKAWDITAQWQCEYSKSVNHDDLLLFKEKRKLKLIPGMPVPKNWIDFLFETQELDILVLGGAGGKQSIELASLGHKVSVVDISEKQIEIDQLTANKFNLDIGLYCQSADDLSCFSPNSFDVVVMPCFTCFLPDLKKIWSEVSSVIRPNAKLIYAFINPICYLFDWDKKNNNEFVLKYSLPYSDLASLSKEDKKKFIGAETPVEFSHSLTDHLGKLCQSGFVIEDLVESKWESDDPLNQYFPQFIQVISKKI